MSALLLDERLHEACEDLMMLPRRQIWKQQRAWLAIYAAEMKSETGQWTNGRYLWHVFSFQFAPAHVGWRAMDSYREQVSGPCLILSADSSRDFGYRCSRVRKPDRLATGSFDAILCPLSMNWTLAITHDPMNGPYYCEKSWINADYEDEHP